MGHGQVGFQRQGLTDQVHGKVMLSPLPRDNAQVMERIGMPRLLDQNLPVDLLGLLQLP